MNIKFKKLLITILFTTFQLTVVASEWGVGLAVITLQGPQAEIPRENFVAPFLTYNSDNLSVDFSSIEYRFYETERLQLALIGQLRFDGFDPSDSALLEGMDERDPAFDAGLSISYLDEFGKVTLKTVADITNTHEGVESELNYTYSFVSGNLLISPTIGFSLQDKSLVKYYYGVNADEATLYRTLYSGERALNQFVQVTFAYNISDELLLTGGFSYTRLDNAITNSPIVTKDQQTATFAAIVYQF